MYHVLYRDGVCLRAIDIPSTVYIVNTARPEKRIQRRQALRGLYYTHFVLIEIKVWTQD